MQDSLDRFLIAQDQVYPTALAELKRGCKASHWMWFILPQLRGLGSSPMSYGYGITGAEEARRYLNHPILGPRLRECVAAICAHAGKSADVILGDIDALKFRSCLTLFATVAKDEALFRAALEQFYAGIPDSKTQEILAREPPDLPDESVT
jgi:Uncharacterized conserved protein